MQIPRAVQRYSGNALQEAAVLIPVICRPVPTLLLTRRADMLRKHPGQVAFPGGVASPRDGSPIVTALREAQEEINIDPPSVVVLGQLVPLESPSGYRVTPVVGLIPPDVHFCCRETEVKDFFEIPLQEALRLSRYYPLTGYYAGSCRQVYLSWYGDKLIWGLTAAIIYQLASQVNQ